LRHHLAVVWIEIEEQIAPIVAEVGHHLAVVWIEILKLIGLKQENHVTTLRWCGLK